MLFLPIIIAQRVHVQSNAWVRSSVSSSVCPPASFVIQWWLIGLLVSSYLCSFARAIIHLHVRSFICFPLSFIPLFIRSYLRSFARLSVYWFVCLFVHKVKRHIKLKKKETKVFRLWRWVTNLRKSGPRTKTKNSRIVFYPYNPPSCYSDLPRPVLCGQINTPVQRTNYSMQLTHKYWNGTMRSRSSENA